MRRLASEVLRDLQLRVARLERQAAGRVFTPEMIQEEYEEADRLSNVDPVLAKYLVTEGDGRSDRIKVGPDSASVYDLNPSQSTMVLFKTCLFAFFYLRGDHPEFKDNNMGAIVSADDNILDGHHRWSAWALAFGHISPNVKFVRAEMTGSKLIRVLNIITKGMFNGRNGNPGKGNIGDYKESNVRKQLEDFALNGAGNAYTAEQIQDTLISNFGSVEEGISQMSRNVRGLNLRVPRWAPARHDMPVINKDEIPQVSKALNSGNVEWNPPYEEIRTARQRREQFRRHY